MKKLILFIIVANMSFAQAQNQTLTIGILDDKQNSDSEALFQKLQKNITDVVGQGTKVIFNDVLYNNYDEQLAKENYTELMANSDIIIAFGVVNTLMIYKEKTYSKPTIIVGSINNDFVKIPEDQKTSEINNLTYLITPFSYKDDLDAVATMFAYKTIGVVVDDYLLDLLPIKAEFDAYFTGKSSTYKFITLHESNNLDSLFNDVDAVYLASTTNLDNAEFDEMVATINAAKLPSLSSYGVQEVEKGVLLTNQPKINIDQIFRRIGLNVESIYKGTNASAISLTVDYDKQLTINMSTADQIEFHITYFMLGNINLIEGASDIASSDSYSMLSLMKGVVGSNLGLEAQRKDISLSEQDIKSSKSSYLPDLTANINGTYLDPKLAEISNGQNPELTTGGNLVLKQTLYSEQATANISIGQSQLAAQKETYNANQLDALLDASVAYINALILKTNANIQNRNLQLTKNNLNIANQNLELGASGKSDVLRFKSEVTQNVLSLIQARNSLSQAYYQINQLLNNPISNKIEIQDTVISTDISQNEGYKFLLKNLDNQQQRLRLTKFLVEEAKRNAPELKNIDYNVDAVVRNYRLNSGGRFVPTVGLQAQYNSAFSRSGVGTEIPTGFPVLPNNDYNLGVNVSLPLFQQNTRNINRQTAKIQEDQLRIQRENTELGLEFNINNIMLDLINEIANIEISAVNEGLAKESMELYQTEYRNGAIPVIQLIDAQNNYLTAQFENATAQYNYFIVSMQLERAIGYFFLMNTQASNQEFIQRANQYINNN
jgi:outer membrane protein TolC